MQYIQSLQNQKIKAARSLTTRKGREQQGAYLVEGTRMVQEAAAYAEIETIILAENFNGQDNWLDKVCREVETLQVPQQLFSSISETETPQGVMAVVKKRRCDLSDISTEGDLLVAAALQDPGNMGTLMRTAAAAGCAAVITTKGTVDIYNAKVIRATMGAIFRVPTLQGIEEKELLQWLSQRGINLVAADAVSGTDLFAANLRQQFALAVGNENHGLSVDLMKQAALVVRIPMNNSSESLNVAVAGSIILYEGLRQQRVLAGLAKG